MTSPPSRGLAWWSRWWAPLSFASLLGCPGPGDLDQAAAPRWEVADSPSVVIGTREAEPGHDLFRVTAATRLSDGRIVVANAGTSEVRVFDATGSYERSLSAEGSGPGELTFLQAMTRVPGDTLLTLSRTPGLSWFHPDDGFVRQAPLDVVRLRIPCWLSEGGWNLLPSGDLLLEYEENPGMSGCPPPPSGVSRRRGLVALYHRARGVLDSLAILPGTERTGGNYRAYGGMLAVTVGSDRIFAGDTRGDSIVVFGADGVPRASLPTPFEPRPVPPEAMREEVRRFTRSDGTEVVGEPYAYPGDYPRFARLLADGVGGNVWVMQFPAIEEPVSSWVFFNPSYFRAPEGGGLWRVLGPDGLLVAEVRTPPGVYPLEVGAEYVLGLRRDALDVLSVGLYDLRR